jgi:hypothetical protein
MTDPITPDPASNSSIPPAPPAAPAYAAAPVGTGGKRALSLTSFILGIASVALFITSWFAVLLGLAAVIIGFIGRSREPGAPRWTALLGIIFGFVGIVVGGIVFIVVVLLVAHSTVRQ